MLDWQDIVNSQYAIGVAAAAVVIAAVVRVGRRNRRRSRHFPNVPARTLQVSALSRQARWRPAAIEGRMAMHVTGEWRAVNTCGVPVQIARAYLKKPEAEGVVVLFDQRDGEGSAAIHEIPVGDTANVSVDFWIDPPPKKLGQTLRAAVVFVDQFGNEHCSRSVAFACEAASEASGPVEAEWVPDALKESDVAQPIELQITAVLREELSRYAQCGRRVGGLGSVQTRYGTNVFSGVGSVWRDAESREGPLIVEDGSDARIESENADLLVGLHQQLGESDQLRFVAALRRRLGRYGECAPVGYLSLLVLFRTGDLREALSTASAYLRGDEGCAFSDFLLMLDGLLRFEHRRFSDMMLRDVEFFIDGIDDYDFGIPERLAEIRRRRASAPLPAWAKVVPSSEAVSA